MTKPNEGKHETKIHKCDEAIEQRNFINLRIGAQMISIGLGFCLTCYLACREQYLDSLLGLYAHDRRRHLRPSQANPDRTERTRIRMARSSEVTRYSH